MAKGDRFARYYQENRARKLAAAKARYAAKREEILAAKKLARYKDVHGDRAARFKSFVDSMTVPEVWQWRRIVFF